MAFLGILIRNAVPMAAPETHMAAAEVLPMLRRNTSDFSVDQQALDRLTNRIVVTAILDGKLPADRINGRWYVKRADMRQIAELLGALSNTRPTRRALPSNSAVIAV